MSGGRPSSSGTASAYSRSEGAVGTVSAGMAAGVAKFPVVGTAAGVEARSVGSAGGGPPKRRPLPIQTTTTAATATEMRFTVRLGILLGPHHIGLGRAPETGRSRDPQETGVHRASGGRTSVHPGWIKVGSAPIN